MAEPKKPWDLTSTHALQGAAEWLLKRARGAEGIAGSLVVVVIRVDDLAIAADLKIAPKDVMHLIEDRGPEIFRTITEAREKARTKGERR